MHITHKSLTYDENESPSKYSLIKYQVARLTDLPRVLRHKKVGVIAYIIELVGTPGTRRN